MLSDDQIDRWRARALRDARLEETQLPRPAFAAALTRGLAHRFGDASPTERDVDRHLETIHLADLALACACLEGDDRAWERFVGELRPVLYRAGRAVTGDDTAGRDLADSIYAELFGITRGPRPGQGASLFRYYHGRSRLATWLRAILAQRHVDRRRTEQRTVATDDAGLERALADAAAPSPPPDPDRAARLSMLRATLRAALARLPDTDRLRLGCYYTRGMTLAAIGRLLGEHEATASRRLARSRRDLRGALEAALARKGLGPDEIGDALAQAAEDWPDDLTRELQEPSSSVF